VTEVWKPLPKYKGWYEISSNGRVKRIAPGCGTRVGKILKRRLTRDGYAYVRVNKKGISKDLRIGKSVCEAFHGPCPKGKQCNHKDGVKLNDVPENLEWATPSENITHSVFVLGNPCFGHTLKKHG
jgi:hypothetical protein